MNLRNLQNMPNLTNNINMPSGTNSANGFMNFANLGGGLAQPGQNMNITNLN